MARKRAAAKPSKAKISPALLRTAADGAAIQMRDKTIALGHFSGVTGETLSPASEWRESQRPFESRNKQQHEKEAAKS